MTKRKRLTPAQRERIQRQNRARVARYAAEAKAKEAHKAEVAAKRRARGRKLAEKYGAKSRRQTLAKKVRGTSIYSTEVEKKEGLEEKIINFREFKKAEMIDFLENILKNEDVTKFNVNRLFELIKDFIRNNYQGFESRGKQRDDVFIRILDTVGMTKDDWKRAKGMTEEEIKEEKYMSVDDIDLDNLDELFT